MTKLRWYGPTLVLLISVIMVMILGPNLTRQITHIQKSEEIRLVQQSLAQSGTLAQLSQAFRDVSNVVEPSVVSIQVLKRVHTRSQRSRRMNPQELFERWFNPYGHIPREFDPFRSPRNEPQRDSKKKADPEKYDQYNPLRPYGSGSGWVFDDQGHIITNNHVVTLGDGKTEADEIKIKFHDGRERIAKVVGRDPKTDIAVLQVDGPVIAATLAKDKVAQGDIVFAFGSPFGIEFSMSQGIVSATNRRNLNIIHDGFEDFIQTDAAINPGNSGGPLTNIHGEVVGMNTAIASRTGAFNGIGFAIPVSIVRNIANQLITSGEVARGFLGIGIQDLPPKLAKTYGLKGKGVLVTKPMSGSPAEKAGLHANDIIVQVNGKKVTTASSLRNYVASNSPGSVLSVKVFRNGDYKTFKVTLARRPENLAQVDFDADDADSKNPDADVTDEGLETLRKLGIEEASTFTKEQAQKFNVKFIPGLLVKTVRPGSEAQRKGLRSGTLITHIMSASNHAVDLPVTSLKQFTEELAKHDLTQGVRIRVSLSSRNGWRTLIVLLELENNGK